MRLALIAAVATIVTTTAAQPTVTKYVRYSQGGTTSYGILDGDSIRELRGDLFASPAPTGKRVKLAEVATVVSYLSKYVTLEPGDVIFTGTPGTTRAFKAGDTIEVVIEGIGTLRNRAVKGAVK